MALASLYSRDVAASKKKASKKKASKKKSSKKKSSKKRATARGLSLRVEDKGPTADSKGRLYYGTLCQGTRALNIGTVVAKSSEEARRKLRSIARVLLK